MQFKAIFSVVILSFLALGSCTPKDTTRLGLKIEFASNKVTSTGALHASSIAWNTSLNPTLASDFNCFALAVSEPESPAEQCTTATGLIFPWTNATFGSSATALEVPAMQGKDRRIWAVGWKASTAAACASLKNTEVAAFMLSQPFILGEATIDISGPDAQAVIKVGASLGETITSCTNPSWTAIAPPSAPPGVSPITPTPTPAPPSGPFPASCSKAPYSYDSAFGGGSDQALAIGVDANCKVVTGGQVDNGRDIVRILNSAFGVDTQLASSTSDTYFKTESIATLPDGSSLVAGTTADGFGGRMVWLKRFTSSGALMPGWNKSFPVSGELSLQAHVTYTQMSGGGVAVLVFRKWAGSYSLQMRAYNLTDASENMAWSKPLFVSGNGQALAIARDENSGAIYVGGVDNASVGIVRKFLPNANEVVSGWPVVYTSNEAVRQLAVGLGGELYISGSMGATGFVEKRDFGGSILFPAFTPPTPVTAMTFDPARSKILYAIQNGQDAEIFEAADNGFGITSVYTWPGDVSQTTVKAMTVDGNSNVYIAGVLGTASSQQRYWVKKLPF